MTTINCTTEFRTAQKEMVQTFDNGVVLITCRRTGITGVYINGELKTTYERLLIEEYMRLQIEVQEMKIV